MNITIIGAGNTGTAMAAHATSQGHQVTLWNRNEEEIPTLINTQTVYSTGVIEGEYKLHLVTTDMDQALIDADLILVTTPSFAHKSLAENIAKSIQKETLVILLPGRTFGAVEFKDVYEQFNHQTDIAVAETQTAIYTCRKVAEDKIDILSIKRTVLFSALKSSENEQIFKQLPTFLKDSLIPSKSIIETSIGNIGMILHCTPLLLNTGWTENEKYSYKYYIDGITPSVAHFLEKLDQERMAVAKGFGLEIESLNSWLNRIYGVEGSSLYERIQETKPYEKIDAPNTLNNRYITEDVPNGLVPLESAGKFLNLDMQYTGLVIDLASALLDTDFREHGRNLKTLFESKDEVIQSLFYRGEG